MSENDFGVKVYSLDPPTISVFTEDPKLEGQSANVTLRAYLVLKKDTSVEVPFKVHIRQRRPYFHPKLAEVLVIYITETPMPWSYNLPAIKVEGGDP